MYERLVRHKTIFRFFLSFPVGEPLTARPAAFRFRRRTAPAGPSGVSGGNGIFRTCRQGGPGPVR